MLKNIVRAASLYIFVSAGNALANAECKRLPLNKVQEVTVSAPEIYDILFKFENAFTKEEFSEFDALIHPALIKSKDDRRKIFQEIAEGFNLKKTILVRSRLFEIDFNNSKSNEATCGDIQVHGVTGPQKQFAALYTYTNGGEQYRLFVIFAPLLKEQKDAKKTNLNYGMVLIHTQLWSHAGLSPEAMIQESRDELKKGHQLSAWMYATAALRILEGNPYVTYEQTRIAKGFSKELTIPKNIETDIHTQLQTAVPSISFLNFTIVYQAQGIELGAKLQSSKDLSIDDVLKTCQTSLKAIRSQFEEIRKTFKGVECLLYLPKENLQDPPQSGSKFYTWSDLN